MTLPNRVTPFMSLEAAPARGLLMGNRGGRFHDPATRAVPGRPWCSRQWICCVLSFKGRQRAVWGAGYTELFFCDEVTALASGHRPCMECRRADAMAFRSATMIGGAFDHMPSCPDLDRRLDAERRIGRAQRRHARACAGLPDGAMLGRGGQAFAVKAGRLLLWSQAGYARASLPLPDGEAEVLTPPVTLAALAAGYRPLWHPSAALADVTPARDRAPPSSP
jgi:hypothetical protein